MSLRFLILFTAVVQLLVSCGPTSTLDGPKNTWIRVTRDEKGARRHSSLRYAGKEGYFVLWGFMGHVTEFYGGPEDPPAGTPEYDVVFFDPAVGSWQNHLPFEKKRDWMDNLPPLHMCSSYQGITTGSYRPQLKMREGVLRPDLNIVFDQVAYDSRRNRMVYFTGGRTLAYELSSRSWNDIAPGQNPPPVVGGSLTYDPLNDELVLTGGGHVAENDRNGNLVGFTGTWTYGSERAEWQELESTREPPPRMATRMVYDERNEKMVVFGGDGQSKYLGDTWLYDVRSRSWQQSKSLASPPARAGHFAVFDPESGWVIIGGGYNRQDLHDMWAFDASRDQWYKLQSKVPAGWHITADIKPDEGLIVLLTANKPKGDQMHCNEIYSVRTTYAFKLDGQGLVDRNWTPSPEPQGEIPKRSVAESTGGTQPDAERRQLQSKRLEGIPDNRWVLLEDPGRSAPVRTWGSCTFDTRRGRIVYWGGGHCGYGGNDYDFYDVRENTWSSLPVIPEFPERAWDRGVNPAGVTFNGAPWIRHGRKIYAYDPVSDKIVNMKTIYLTAGYDPELLRDFEPREPLAQEGGEYSRSGYVKWVTWAFDPVKGEWELVCSGLPGMDLTVTTPHGVMAVDYNWRLRDPGNSQIETPFDQLPIKENHVYLLNLQERHWKRLSERGPWPQNLYEMTALVFDTRRNQLVLHGAGPHRDELWAFAVDRRTWQKLSPKGQAPVCRREAVYIPSQDCFFTCGYPHSEPDSSSVYVYRFGENRWFRLRIPTPAGRRADIIVAQNRAISYDPVNDLVLMVLGDTAADSTGAAVYAMRFNRRTINR